MAFMSRRQISMFVLIGGFIFAKLLVALIEKYDKGGTEQAIRAMTSYMGKNNNNSFRNIGKFLII